MSNKSISIALSKYSIFLPVVYKTKHHTIIDMVLNATILMIYSKWNTTSLHIYVSHRIPYMFHTRTFHHRDDISLSSSAKSSAATVFTSWYLLYQAWCNATSDSKAGWAHVRPTWSQQDPRWTNVVPTKFAIWDCTYSTLYYSDVIMSTNASKITDVSIVYPTVCSGADKKTHQRSASLAFMWGIHRWSVNYPHKGPVTRTMIPFDDVIKL